MIEKEDQSGSDFDNDSSMWRLVSIGTVASNKPLDTNIISVMPHEKLSFADGEIADKVDTLEYKGKNSSNESVSGTAFVGQTVEASWRPEGNRVTAPDVRRGERVELWQFAGNDKYYWKDIALDRNLRRLETVRIQLNANPEVEQSDDPENNYYIEASTHNKTITLETSKKNGEYCTYSLQIDTASGRIVITDDIGNHILLDSKATNIQFTNVRGTQIELNKNDINVNAVDNFNLKAGKNINMKAGQSVNVIAGKSVNVNAGADINCTAAGTAMISGGGSVLTLMSGGTTLSTPSFAGTS